jgi:vanillate monooxygenase ferredoxin subunit
MNDTVQEGDILEISEPRNHFHLVHAQRTLLFAGGIGVTPLLCMARRLHSIGADYEMHYCARSIARTAFRDEITASPMAGRVSFHFDDGPPESRLDLPAVMDRPHPGTHLYVCGPTGFIDWVVGTARGQGWSGDHVHVEHFGATPQDTHGDQAFQVKIASSGAVYDIPAGQSVAAALEQHGVAIQVSCEQGVCGTCLTRVLEGDCDHRDHYLTEEEKARNDQFTPCSSRARSKMLVLDL